MKDPLASVLESLHSLFQLEITRNGKYTFQEVQHLKERTDEYHSNPTRHNFIQLKKAVKGSMSYIEKWQLDFEPIKKSLDQEAQSHGLPPIDWQKLLSNSKASPTFKFSALNHEVNEEDFIEWITSKNGTPYNQLTHNKLTQLLIDHKDENGFSKKLGQHLRKDPDFLFHLITKSAKNFTKVASSLLILYLTDEQLATAIIKHIPEPAKPHEMTYEEVSNLVDQLNQNLSYGRSISTLLRNANAKAILDTSVIFELYQSEEHIHNEGFHSHFIAHQGRHVHKHFF